MTTATLNVYHRHTEPVSVSLISRHPGLVSGPLSASTAPNTGLVSGPLSANTTRHTVLVSVSRIYVTLKYNQDDAFY